MSKFTDLFQESVPSPEPISTPIKVEEVVTQKPTPTQKITKKKFTLD